MNDWRENLHPRGGDQEHPGRFSAGHGGGRHYNPPPGQEHLAMHQPAGRPRHRREGAFYGCTNLTSIALSNSFTTIGHYAFDNWVMLVRK